MCHLETLLRKTTQTIAIVLTCCACSVCQAQSPEVTQNPLRHESSSRRTKTIPARFEADPNAKPLKQTHSMSGILDPLESATHSIAELAGHGQTVNASPSSNDTSDTRHDANFLRTAYNEKIETQLYDSELQQTNASQFGLPFEVQALPSDEDMFGLAGSVAVNCLFVLSIGIAFILIARRRLSSGSNKSNAPEKLDELRVQQVLKIDSKNTLRIIRWRHCDVLVASDSTGIKSVNVLSSSFQESLEEEQTKSEELNEIVKKFLEKES